ncbi:MAG: ATP-binding protein [Actinomycetota bacterium]|nr:ATP-binding protein [Actinomycetota bacterium]
MPNLPVFTPTAVPAEELAARTVGRDELIGRLQERVARAASSEGRPHTLIVGPRGSGKTHLVAIVLHELRRDPGVAGGIAVARLPEDALSIASYEDLLFEVISALGGSDEAGALRAGREGRGLERLLTRLIDGRMLLLVVENLDRVFANIGLDGQHRLRAFVETEGSTMLLATSPLLFEGVSARERPWYGSFIPEHLPDLTLEEGTELLRRVAVLQGEDALAEFLVSDTGQARLRAVEHLAGGSPRLWMVLAGCMTIETLDRLVPAVEALLDALAPYYQQRLWELPPNEQKLVIELCRGPGLRTVKDVASAAGLSEQVTATSLRRLVQARWVRGNKQPGTDQRTTWYEVREPLLRHHVQYRSATGEPLGFIVAFLRTWFSVPELLAHWAATQPRSDAARHLTSALVDVLGGPKGAISLAISGFATIAKVVRPGDVSRPFGGVVDQAQAKRPAVLLLLLLSQPDAIVMLERDGDLQSESPDFAADWTGSPEIMVGVAWSTLSGSPENRRLGIELALNGAGADHGPSLSVGLLTALGMSMLLKVGGRQEWLAAWIDALRTRPALRRTANLLAAANEALDGDRSALLPLPPEVRGMVEAALNPDEGSPQTRNTPN